jgi:hypothetical protein
MLHVKQLGRAAAALVAVIFMSSCITISDPPEGLTVLTIIGGNSQTVVVNSFAGSPLVVQALDEAAGPLSGVNVTWEITAGAGTLGSSSSVSDETGAARTTFKASANTGPVQIRATAEDLTVNFQLDVVAGG